MARKRSGARRAPRPSEAESYPRLPPFGAEFSLGPATRSYRSPMVTAAGSGMAVPSFEHADEMDDAVEMGGEAVDQSGEADLLDESAAEADGTEEDVGSEAEADDEDAEANGEEAEGNDENGET
jgi:hypothetical protein